MSSLFEENTPPSLLRFECWPRSTVLLPRECRVVSQAGWREAPPESQAYAVARSTSIPARYGQGCFPERAEEVFLLLDTPLQVGMVSAAVSTNCSACRTSSMDVAQPFANVWVSRNESWRKARVRREISSCRSSERSWK